MPACELKLKASDIFLTVLNNDNDLSREHIVHFRLGRYSTPFFVAKTERVQYQWV